MLMARRAKVSVSKCRFMLRVLAGVLRSDGLFAEHGGQVGFDGFGPEAVAGGGEVQEIAHHVLGDLAVGLDEEVADVEEANGVAVVELVQGLVDLECFGALSAEILAKGENAQEKDFGVGQPLAEFPDETFVKADVDLEDAWVAAAVRKLQASCGALQEHAWEVSDDRSKV